MPENRHNFQGRGIQDNALDPTMFQVPRFWAQGNKLHQKNVLIVGDLMSPATKAVVLTRTKPSGSMWSKNKFNTP